MAFGEFPVGDLVMLIDGASGESKAIWRVKDLLITESGVKLEKYKGPDTLPQKITTEQSNIRKLNDDELESLARWSRGSFVCVTCEGHTYIGEVRSIIWDREKGVSAGVMLSGERISKGITRSGEPDVVPHTRDNRYWYKEFRDAELTNCTEQEVEWLKVLSARSSKKFVLPEPQYEYYSGDDSWWVKETVKVTSVSEIVKAVEEQKEKDTAGPMRVDLWIYGTHNDDKGERYYTKQVTRHLDSEEVEQLGLRSQLRSQQQERIPSPQITFDDIFDNIRTN